jgi:shikimate 5-dehydrogenase
VEGFELLVAQAVLQFALLTGTNPPRDVVEAAGRAWLDGPGRGA